MGLLPHQHSCFFMVLKMTYMTKQVLHLGKQMDGTSLACWIELLYHHLLGAWTVLSQSTSPQQQLPLASSAPIKVQLLGLALQQFQIALPALLASTLITPALSAKTALSPNTTLMSSLILALVQSAPVVFPLPLWVQYLNQTVVPALQASTMRVTMAHVRTVAGATINLHLPLCPALGANQRHPPPFHLGQHPIQLANLSIPTQ